MSYINSNLIPGETVIYQTRLHWLVMLGHIVVGCFLLAFPGALLLYYALSGNDLARGTTQVIEGAGVALLICGIVVVLFGMARRNSTEMAVTSRRVVIKTGLTSRKTIEMLLNKVESIEVNETTLGKLLGYGSIVVVGTGGSTEPFRNVAHPLEFRSQVQRQIERLGSHV
jgi:Bacterial PH domain